MRLMGAGVAALAMLMLYFIWSNIQISKNLKQSQISQSRNLANMSTASLDENDRPDPRYKGETFRRFVRKLEHEGYKVEYRLLRACDYGAPTMRRRFFLIARCDGKPIVWPEPTHGEPGSLEVVAGLLKPWVPVADVLDFSLPCPSIFDTSEEIMEKFGIKAVRPLAENTMRRIARGVMKFVIDNPRPFIVQVNHSGDGFRGQEVTEPLDTITAKHGTGVIMPSLIQMGYGEAEGQKPRTLDIQKPLGTVVAQGNKFGLVSTFISKYYDTPFFFGSRALQQTPYVTIELKQVYRQSDEQFLHLLNSIREGRASKEVFENKLLVIF